jgi:hypothetical protein
MKRSKRSFTIVSALFAVLLSSSTETLNARDADLASRTFAAEALPSWGSRRGGTIFGSALPLDER